MFSLQNTALRSKFDRKTGTTYCRNMISLKNISLSNPSPVIVSLLSSWATKGTVELPNQMTFQKSSNPKIYIADFGNFKQAFLSMRLIQKSNFRVQGMFFNNRIDKNQNQTHSEEGTSESLHYLALIIPCIYATISIINN